MQRTAMVNWLSDGKALVLALILGAIAAGLIVAYLASRGEEEVKPAATAFVVVAAEDIDAGEKVTDAMVAIKSLPREAVVEDSFSARSLVVGKTARYPITKGEQITTGRLVETAGVKALSFQIPPGMRGVTIPVSVENSPAALLAPGDFVDIILSIDVDSVNPALLPRPLPPATTEGRDEMKAVFTLYQNVQVLAVQRQRAEDAVQYDASVRGEVPKDGNVSYVTLALTPEQAQTLWLAQQGRDAELTLTLRPFGDAEIRPVAVAVEPFLMP